MRSALTPYSVVVIDGAFVVAYHLAVPALALRFTQKSAGNALLIAAAYIAVCVAAFLVRRLAPAEQPPAQARSGGLVAVAGLFFGFFVLFMADETSGFSASLDLSAGASTTVVSALAAIGGIALALAFSIILFIEPKRAVAAGTTRYALSHAAALIIVNSMVLCLLAFWRAYFETDTEPYEDLAIGGKILIFVFVYVFYLLFLTAPRLLLLSLDFQRLALASFLLSSAYFVWSSLSHAAW